MLSVSVVIPTYNERENVGILVPRVHETLSSRSHEVIVVDDDSPDGTGEAVAALAKNAPWLRLITRKGRRGLGAALAEGYDAARRDVVVSMDADLSFHWGDIARLVERVEAGADLALGTRHMEGGGYEAQALDVRIKRCISALGNRIVRLATKLPVRDVSANFRAVRRTAWPSIRTEDRTNFMLLEMILRARAAGCAIQEVPVRFGERTHGSSKLNFFVEVPRFLLRLARQTLRPL
ncbi:MAG: polyprenol monophosphomannose synthase [Elusimicrobia bacterium]|nr:polyprenol monophosphomannose synthase [Elusimicrobiota bacterium]